MDSNFPPCGVQASQLHSMHMRPAKMREIFCKEMQPHADKLKTQRGQLQIIVDKAKVGRSDPYNS